MAQRNPVADRQMARLAFEVFNRWRKYYGELVPGPDIWSPMRLLVIHDNGVAVCVYPMDDDPHRFSMQFSRGGAGKVHLGLSFRGVLDMLGEVAAGPIQTAPKLQY